MMGKPYELICIYIYIYVYMCVCMYIYIYIKSNPGSGMKIALAGGAGLLAGTASSALIAVEGLVIFRRHYDILSFTILWYYVR